MVPRGQGQGWGWERGLALKGQQRDPGGDGNALCLGGENVSTLAEISYSSATIMGTRSRVHGLSVSFLTTACETKGISKLKV